MFGATAVPRGDFHLLRTSAHNDPGYVRHGQEPARGMAPVWLFTRGRAVGRGLAGRSETGARVSRKWGFP